MDMATSVVAQGKIIMASKAGEQIPPAWAITKEGESTTDPKKALEGSVLPFGGAKGYSIAVLIDILCGVLSGALFGPHLHNMWNDFKNPQNVGHFFLLFEIKRFTDPEIFKVRIDQMIREIKASPKAKGIKEIFLPGEIELNLKNLRKEKGVPVSHKVIEDLAMLGNDTQVPIGILEENRS